MEAKLVVIGGKANMGEVKLRLPMTIGRGHKADLMISHPTVSREHCQLFEVSGELVVKDNGSSNGTFVDGAKIEKQTVVKPGQILAIGPLTFRAEYDAPTARLAPGKKGDLADTQAIDKDDIDIDFLLDDEPAKPAPAKPKAAPAPVAKKPAEKPAEKKTQPPVEAKGKKPAAPAPAPAAPPSKAPASAETGDIDVDFLLDDLAEEKQQAPAAKDTSEIDFSDLDFGEPAAKSAEPKAPESKAKKPTIAPPAVEEFEQTIDFSAKTEADDIPPLLEKNEDVDFDFLSDLGEAEPEAASKDAHPFAGESAAAPGGLAADSLEKTESFEKAEAVDTASAAAPPADDIDLGDFFDTLDVPAAEAPQTESSADSTQTVDIPADANLDDFLSAIDLGPAAEAKAPSEPEDVATTPSEPVSLEPKALEPKSETEDDVDFSALAETQDVEVAGPQPAEDFTIDLKKSSDAPAFDFLDEAAAASSPEKIESSAEATTPEPEIAAEFAPPPAAEPAAREPEPEFDFLAELEQPPAEEPEVAPESTAVESDSPESAAAESMEFAAADEAAPEEPSSLAIEPEQVTLDSVAAPSPAADEVDFDFLADEPTAEAAPADVAADELMVESPAAEAPVAEEAMPEPIVQEFLVPDPIAAAEPPAVAEAPLDDFLAPADEALDVVPTTETTAERTSPAADFSFLDELGAETSDEPAVSEAAAETEATAETKSVAASSPVAEEPVPQAEEPPAVAAESAAQAAADDFDFLSELSAAPAAAAAAEAPSPAEEPAVEGPSAERAEPEIEAWGIAAEATADASETESPADEVAHADAAAQASPEEARAEPTFDFDDFTGETAAASPPPSTTESEAQPEFAAFEPTSEPTSESPFEMPTEPQPAEPEQPVIAAAAAPVVAPSKPVAPGKQTSILDKIKTLFGASKKEAIKKSGAKKGAAKTGKGPVVPASLKPLTPLPPLEPTAKAADAPIPIDDAPIPLFDAPATTEAKFEYGEPGIRLDDDTAAEATAESSALETAEPDFASFADAEVAPLEAAADSPALEFAESSEPAEAAFEPERPVAEQFTTEPPAIEQPTAEQPADDFFASLDVADEAPSVASSLTGDEPVADESQIVPATAPEAVAEQSDEFAIADEFAVAEDSAAADEAAPPASALTADVPEPGEAAPPASPNVAPMARRPHSIDVDLRLTSSMRSLSRLAVQRPHIDVPQMEPEEPHGRSFAPRAKSPTPESGAAQSAASEPAAAEPNFGFSSPEDSASDMPAAEAASSADAPHDAGFSFDEPDFGSADSGNVDVAAETPSAQAAGEPAGEIDDAFDFLATSSEESAAREAKIEAAQDAESGDIGEEEEFFAVLDEPAAETPPPSAPGHEYDATMMFNPSEASDEAPPQPAAAAPEAELDLGFLDLEVAPEATSDTAENPLNEPPKAAEATAEEPHSPTKPVGAAKGKAAAGQDEDLEDFFRDLGMN